MISASLITLPQFMVDLSLHNTWVVPIFLFVVVYGMMFFGLSKLEKVPKSERHFSSDSKKVKTLACLFILFFAHVLIRDIRILLGFISTTLIPLTPKYVIIILLIGTVLYLAMSGIEVIARFTELYYFLFIGVILFIPLSLGTQISVENFEPMVGLKVIPSLLQSSYIGLAWMGEAVAVIMIIWLTSPKEGTRKAVFWGIGFGITMLFILIFSQIAVLGSEIVRYSTYPSYTLVQQIRLTEFLDRLDFVLVAFYFPTVFAKMSFFLYGLHRSLTMLNNKMTNITMVPLAIIMGVLAVTLFENVGDTTEFSIFTWASLGLILELLILALTFMIIRTKLNNKQREKKEEKDHSVSH